MSLSLPPARTDPLSPSAAGQVQAGYTLVELIVVVLVVAILFSLMTLSLPSSGGQQQARTEAQRLLELIRLAREEAMIRSSLMGFSHQAESYRFHRFDGHKWLAPDDASGPFRARSLPEGIRLSLSIDGDESRPAVASDTGADADADAEEGDALPELLFWPDGQISGFQLSLNVADSAGGTARYQVVGSPAGSLQLLESQDAKR